jgi:hypothetical protein
LAIAPISLLVIAVGCGGTDFQSALGGDDSGTGNDSGAGDSSTQGDSATAKDTGAMTDAPPPPCPDVTGAYSIVVIDGAGCGDLNALAPECIRGAAASCNVELRSQVSGGGPAAINGNASIQNDGSFSGAALTEGTGNRTGCVGSWDATTSTMTVDCGGMASTQSCVVALTRTKALCN